MRKKKIAIVLSLKPQDGGGFQYALMIAQCLKKMSNTQMELMAIHTHGYWGKWCEENNIKHTKINWPIYSETKLEKNLKFPLYSRVYSMYMTELGDLIRKEKIDILFLTGQLIFVPNLKVKIITPVFDLMHRYEPNFSEVKENYRERELLFSCQAKYADYILTDSEIGKKQFYESYLKKGGRNPHVIGLPFVAPEHIWKVKEQSIEVPEKYVFYPAQFWKHKNHLNLVKAIKILKESIPDICLVLAGSEKNCCREIKRYISDNNLEDHVIMLGFVRDENIVYLYKHAVGMIMPSYFGPTNIPPLEAMALGCPVAVSNKYAMPEQVGEAGLLFDPDLPLEIAECIRKLWLDENLRMKMKSLGYKRIKEWGPREFEKRVFKIVKKCLQN